MTNNPLTQILDDYTESDILQICVLNHVFYESAPKRRISLTSTNEEISEELDSLFFQPDLPRANELTERIKEKFSDHAKRLKEIRDYAKEILSERTNQYPLFFASDTIRNHYDHSYFWKPLENKFNQNIKSELTGTRLTEYLIKATELAKTTKAAAEESRSHIHLLDYRKQIQLLRDEYEYN